MQTKTCYSPAALAFTIAIAGASAIIAASDRGIKRITAALIVFIVFFIFVYIITKNLPNKKTE